jgi:hypothetical protein
MGPSPVLTGCYKHGVFQWNHVPLCSMALSVGGGTLIVLISKLIAVMIYIGVSLLG